MNSVAHLVPIMMMFEDNGAVDYHRVFLAIMPILGIAIATLVVMIVRDRRKARRGADL